WRTRTEIEFELDLLHFLHRHHLPVAYPLETQTGDLSIEIDAPEGKRYAALFVYAPGTIALGDLNLVQSHKLGETVAKLHHTALTFQSQAYRQPLTLEYLLDQSFQTIAPFLQDKPHDLSYLIESVDQIKSQLQHFPQDPPLWSVCWGDPHSGNVHFTEDNQLMLFDFDQCGYGWRIFEIAKFLQVSLNSGLAPKIREAFIQGYQSVTVLQPDELAALQAFTAAAHIWSWSICLTHTMFHDYSRLDTSYFHHRIEHLKMLRSPDWHLF
ncbi:MAG TPA: phosphotransferase, partial [Allocoleopsis sp.]